MKKIKILYEVQTSCQFLATNLTLTTTVSLRNEFIDQGTIIFTSSIQSLGDLLHASNSAMFWIKESVPLKESHLVEDADIK